MTEEILDAEVPPPNGEANRGEPASSGASPMFYQVAVGDTIEPAVLTCTVPGMIRFLIAEGRNWAFVAGANGLPVDFNNPVSGAVREWPDEFFEPIPVSPREVWMYNFCRVKSPTGEPWGYWLSVNKDGTTQLVDPSIDNQPRARGPGPGDPV